MNKNKLFELIPLFFWFFIVGLFAFLMYILFSERATFYISEKDLILSYSDSHLITVYDYNKNKVDNLKFIFSSDNPDVVSVDENGMIYSKAYGEANITITSRDDNSSIIYKVTVVDDDRPFIKFTSNSVTLKLNDNHDLFNEILFNNIKKEKIFWKSDDTNIVSINKDGKITAVGIGTTTISATYEKLTTSCEVNVINDNVEVTSIKLNKDHLVLEKNTSERIFTTIMPDNATNRNVIWETSNSNIASVDNNGNIFANNVGTVTITAKINNISVSCNVTVVNEIIKVESILLNKENITIDNGDKKQLVASINPKNSSNKKIIWTSSNPNVVSVDENGYVTGVGVGSATITARIDNITSTCIVTVKTIEAKKIILNKDNLILEKGSTSQLNATIEPTRATDKKIIWTSSNPKVATVDSNGLISAVDTGITVITARINNVTTTCKVTVKTITVKKISFEETSVILEKGSKKSLTVLIEPGNATNKTIEWSSSNNNVVKVDENGNIEAVGLGTANIVAKTNDKTAICDVIVKDMTNPSSSPTLNIVTETDSYTITGGKENINKKYYSNDKDVTIHILSNDNDVEYYAFSNSLDGVKTKYSIKQPISISLNDSSWYNLYVWSIDNGGNYSDYYTNLSVKYDKILLVYDDYSFSNNNGNATIYGANASSKFKKSGSTYNNYTLEQRELLNRYLINKLAKYKSKRNATVAAAKFLTIEFSTQINYQSLNKYLNKGINFSDQNSCWGCNVGNNKTYGMQCSGFVAWSLINGGIDKFANYSTPYINSLYLGGFLSPNNWVSELGYEEQYSSITDDNLIVSRDNIIDINSSIPWSKVQVGDLVSYAKKENGKYTGGHVGMIIILSEKYVYVAHASEAYAPSGLQMTRYKKEDFHKVNAYKNGHIVLMDEVYKS